MKRRIQLTAVLTAVNFLILSHVSGYRADVVKSFNWDIALMLTPYGLIKNLILSHTYLSPYYFTEVQHPPGFSFFPTAIFVFTQIALSFYLLELLKRARR